MPQKTEEEERSYNILVYGIDRRDLTAPSEPITTRNYSLSFEPFRTSRRFDEYDGVVLFQGIFEQFEWGQGGYSEPHLEHSFHKDELDKRKKEAELLAANGGFMCFLLNSAFIDQDGRRDFSGHDLAKYHLGYESLHRENFNDRVAQLKIKSDEFKEFLERYGAASSFFNNYNRDLELKVLAEAGSKTVGMIIERNYYFLPTLIPDNLPDVIEEYFRLLGEGLTSSHNKLQITLPAWLEGFCGARRMADSAAHLVDEVFPERPIRQWVLSFPFRSNFASCSRRSHKS